MRNYIVDSLMLRPGVAEKGQDLIEDIVEDAIVEVKDYINQSYEEDLEPKAVVIVKEIAIIKINKIGSEGVASESYSGQSQSFIDGLPKDLVKKIRRLRKLPR